MTAKKNKQCTWEELSSCAASVLPDGWTRMCVAENRGESLERELVDLGLDEPSPSLEALLGGVGGKSGC